ncbi:MAG: M3 family metallopeptidase [Halofilum sp. (in: g-proteobacteria)]|nr:M3 family metallopeptidase [Halofilum sp. (in: g-proteobacteria)]
MGDALQRPDDNPLLADAPLPPFDRIDPAHVEPAIDCALEEARRDLERVTAAGDASWDGLVVPVERLLERIDRVWSPVRHLHAVASGEAIRAAYRACLPRLSRFHTELGQNRALHDAYVRLADSDEYAALSTEQRKAVDDALRDFRLAGVDLPEDQRTRFGAIQSELSELESAFEEHVLDATQAWKHPVSEAAGLSGLDAEALAMARAAAEREGLDGWLITLDPPLFHAVMTNADDRQLRRAAYEAWTTRASEVGPHAGQWDNGPLMERIIALRQEKARLLGYANFAQLALATRMVERSDDVFGFLNELAGRALPAARAELDELTRHAAEHCGIVELEPWDIAYVAEKLRRNRFEISDEILKPWFPAPRVIEGLFAVCKRLFGIDIRAELTVAVWHPDVQYYRVEDAAGNQRGGFYLDLYARRDKRGGAWMDVCRDRVQLDSDEQLPIAYLTCNLSPPVEGRPALFTHDEVTTLFHEFGHGLHHMLTRVGVPSVAGINGVEWDAVELPSQLLENWCWERAAMDLVSGHVDTGEPLPDDLLERLRASRNFHAALGLLRQIEFSLFDLRLHDEHEAPSVSDIQTLLQHVRDSVAMIHPPAYNRFAHGFSHIFAGGYAAGYYSYKWAEVLSADAFSAFEENGVFDRETGERFLHEFLERGGSRPAIESYRAFRGRDPDPSALLRQSGLAA